MSESQNGPNVSAPSLTTQIERHRPLIEIVEPIDIDRLANAFKKFEDFKRRLLSKDDSITIAGRQYLKKSAWRKYAMACAVSDEILNYERIPPQGKDSDGNFCYRVVVRAFHKPTGRSSIGVAVASRAEKKEWAHEEHDIFALCHTRAKNRAIADLVGGGEVSAEEIVPSEASQESKTTEAAITPSTSTPTTPEASKETWTVRVPVTKDVVTIPGVKQYPLIDGTRAVGMVSYLADGSEVSVVSEKTIPADSPTIRNFLIPRVLDAIRAKHPHVEYRLDIDRDGMLRAVLLRGKLEEAQIRELGNAARWTFQRALEKQTQPP